MKAQHKPRKRRKVAVGAEVVQPSAEAGVDASGLHHHVSSEEAAELVSQVGTQKAGGLERRKEADNAREQRKRDGEKGMPVLPWMRVPIAIESGEGVPFEEVKGLDGRLQTALQAQGFKELYPVQAAAWNTLAGGMSKAHDLCICAPTGSGKTLSYALPILQRLATLPEHILGALIVLPTRELALQVFGVFAKLSPAAGLWVGLAAAKLSLAAEGQAFRQTPPGILVATPGRLVAHLKAEPPTFSLSNLNFLVVDETDRLLRQSYQDWLPFCLAEIAKSNAEDDIARVVKIIVSATLTQDPSKIGRLSLRAPRYISMSSSDHRYKVPKQLKEYKVVSAAADKPLLLTALLQHMAPAKTVVFTGSLLATDRLHLFLRCLSSSKPEEVAVHSGRRREEVGGLAAFSSGAARVLVASDALTRGMDVPGIELVINYDPPVYPKTYVHRAGRTARAGLGGTVITMLTTEQVRHFKTMLRKVDNTFVKDFTFPPKLVTSLRPDAQEALRIASEATALEGGE